MQRPIRVVVHPFPASRPIWSGGTGRLRRLRPRGGRECHHNATTCHFHFDQALELRSDADGEPAEEVDLMVCVSECGRTAGLGGFDELLPHQSAVAVRSRASARASSSSANAISLADASSNLRTSAYSRVRAARARSCAGDFWWAGRRIVRFPTGHALALDFSFENSRCPRLVQSCGPFPNVPNLYRVEVALRVARTHPGWHTRLGPSTDSARSGSIPACLRRRQVISATIERSRATAAEMRIRFPDFRCKSETLAPGKRGRNRLRRPATRRSRLERSHDDQKNQERAQLHERQ